MPQGAAEGSDSLTRAVGRTATQESFGGENVTVYPFQVSSSNGAAINVTMTPTSGATVSLSSLQVPASGPIQLYLYVPTTLQGSITVTCGSSGYESSVIPIAGPN